MTDWWEIATDDQNGAPPKPRAVACYRHSAQDRQENSIPIQQDQVRQFAQEHGIEIIEEFADAGISGLNAEDQPAFTQMMDDWVKHKDDFQYVLCLDVSRWGRFQDIDPSAPEADASGRLHGENIAMAVELFGGIFLSFGSDPLDGRRNATAEETSPVGATVSGAAPRCRRLPVRGTRRQMKAVQGWRPRSPCRKARRGARVKLVFRRARRPVVRVGWPLGQCVYFRIARLRTLWVILWTRSSGPWGRVQCDQGSVWPGGELRPWDQKMVDALKTKLSSGPG